MLLRRKLFRIDRRHLLLYCGFGILLALAIELRVSLYSVETSDYTVFVSQWYEFIRTHDGFAAFKYNFSNYNVPYLYLLALTTYLPIPKLIAIKTLSVVFDGVLGLFVYLILNLRYKRSYAAIAGVLVVMYAPTIFINSAAWGQCDAIYTAFCLGSLYFLLKERSAWACVFFALALSFKLQAIFFLPVLLMLLLRRKLPLKYLALIPLVFLLLLIPAYIAGRDTQSLLGIYVGQITGSSGGGVGPFNGGGIRHFAGGAPRQFTGRGAGPFNGGAPGQFRGNRAPDSSSSSLTLNAPSFYQWLPANAAGYWKWVGISLAAVFIVFVGGLIARSKRQLTPDVLLKVTLVFVLAIPFLLPDMHERYFYLADVVSIIFAFYFPRFWYIAVITQLCSLLSYTPYFLHTQIVSLQYVAGAVLIITVITTVNLVRTLYPAHREKLPETVNQEVSPAGIAQHQD